MTSPSYFTRKFTAALFCTLLFGLAGPSGLVPETEAATSRDKKKISKLKKTVKKLKRQLAGQQIIQVPFPVAVTPPADTFIEMVPVGNVGNAPDQDFGDGQFGAVPYEFQIGKYEVSLAQYTAFLNAVAATDTYNLYDTNMAANQNIAGIERTGSPGSYTYAVIGSGNRPVTYVSWYDAARFCNWLHNGRPAGAQDADTTERGAYTLDGATSGVGIARNPGADFWIPSEDEWYKAAYHQPAGQGGDGDDFWLYPTASNTVPGNDIGPSPLANQANFNDGAYSVTQSGSLDSSQNYLTDSGVYGGSAGPYGTFDQGGNVFEWNDAEISGSFRGLRGGSWSEFEGFLRSSSRFSLGSPDFESSGIGFRVASP